MKSRYDSREDRMLLLLAPPGGERSFWVPRRLWLALYRELTSISPSGREDDDMADVPPSRPAKPIGDQDAARAELLATIKISRTAPDSAALVFRGAGEPVRVALAGPGLVRFKRMLETQADRAGWDAPAGVERLAAEAIAGAAVRRAGA
jgi:hypothetical protein